MASDRYLLGTDPIELDRLRLQHEFWLPELRRGLEAAGLRAGQRVLDLGAGPGFASLELARQVGGGGRVLALELSPTYVEAARQAAAAADLSQLEVRRHDLRSDPLPREAFDLVWCRWVAMFLPAVEPLLDRLAERLPAGARLLVHEYIHWSSFGLHPHGAAVGGFGRACLESFLAAGGDPDVNRNLPSLLAARGFRIEALRPLPVVARPGEKGAAWLERFVTIYGRELIRQGGWNQAEAEAAAAEIAAARLDPGAFWVGPTLMELRATRWAP